MTIDRTVNVDVYILRFDELFTDVQDWGVLCVIQVGYGLGVKTVLVSGSVLCSAGQRATVQRESELGVRGPEWFS